MKAIKLLIIITLLLSIVISIYLELTAPPATIGNFASAASAGFGDTWVASYSGNKIHFNLTDKNGNSKDSFNIARYSGMNSVVIASMSADSDGNLYFIKHFYNTETNDFALEQKLAVYTPGFIRGKVRSVSIAENKPSSLQHMQGFRFTDVRIDSTIILTGISNNADKADGNYRMIRFYYTTDKFKNSQIFEQIEERIYVIDPSEGVYKTAAAGEYTAFITMTGKLYLCGGKDGSSRQIYPDTALSDDEILYVPYFTFSYPKNITFGVRSNGTNAAADGMLMTLNAANADHSMNEIGRTFGTLNYTGADIADMFAYQYKPDMWSATVTNRVNNATGLVVNNGGEFTYFDSINKGGFSKFFNALWRTVWIFLLLLLLVASYPLIRLAVVASKDIRGKLLTVSLVIFLIVFALFGIFMYLIFENSVYDTYRTAISDNGTLLRALIRTEYFENISDPHLKTRVDPTTEEEPDSDVARRAYRYIRSEFKARDVYATSAYYLNGNFYTGIEGSGFESVEIVSETNRIVGVMPVMFPFGMRYNPEAFLLYQAALGGSQQTGMVDDMFGERHITVTPVRSTVGRDLFFIETGMFHVQIDAEMARMRTIFILVGAVFVVASLTVLMLVLRYVLRPFNGIKGKVTRFIDNENDRVNLKINSNSELLKFDGQIDTLINRILETRKELREKVKMYDAYIPVEILEKLDGKETDSHILYVHLEEHDSSLNSKQLRRRVDHFFSITHTFAHEHKALLLSSNEGLSDLCYMCESSEVAILMANSIIIEVERFNKEKCGTEISDREALGISFLLHYDRLWFGKCGYNVNNDGKAASGDPKPRTFPTMLSPEATAVIKRLSELRQLGSRLMLTDSAFNMLENKASYINRKIGAAGINELYDFDFIETEDTPLGSYGLKMKTRKMYEEALYLYEIEQFDSALNLFSMILKENKKDEVVNHYIKKIKERR